MAKLIDVGNVAARRKVSNSLVNVPLLLEDFSEVESRAVTVP